MASADSGTRDSAIGEDENGSDRVDMLLNLSGDTLLVQLVLLRTASVGKPRRVDDANHYSVTAREFVKADRAGLTLIFRIALFVSVVEEVEVVVLNVVADKDIGDEFQDGGLSDTSLTNKEGVWSHRLVL